MTMRLRSATPLATPETPIAAGATIGGWRVARVLTARDDRCTMVETEPRDGRRAILRVFRDPDDETRQRVHVLSRVRAGIDAPLLPVLDAGEDRGLAYVAHPLVRGCTLAELVAEGPLDPSAAMTIVGQIAGALETATLLGLPHESVTPDSVLITSAKPHQALLTDYGFAMPRGAACARASAIAAADYCAPEAARGAPSEPASSVYALGCILVECLTGAPPFPYERPLLTLHAQLVEAPPRVTERRQGLPPALDDVVATALHKQAAQRHASPARFVRAAQKAFGAKAPIPVAVAARRYVDAAAAARRPAPAPKPPRTPSRSAGTEHPLAPAGRRARRREQPAKVADVARRPAKAAATRGKPARAAKPPPRRTRDPHRRERRLWRAPVLGVLLALLASSAGFATGHLSGNRPAANAPAARAPEDSAKRVAYARDVDRVIQRLNADRAAARRALRGARKPTAQATHATALARAYRAARSALPATSTSAVIAAPLISAERAYRALAAAARRHDARAYRTARAEVVRRERDLASALARFDEI